MQLHMEASGSAAIEFGETLGALGLAQQRVAEIFGVESRNIRRWRRGDRPIPRGVQIVFRLLAAGTVTVAQVEQAAAPVLARTNGSAKSEPPASLLGERAPEQSALTRAKAAALVDSSLTTAEKVCALTSNACRWPCGDPEHPDFPAFLRALRRLLRDTMRRTHPIWPEGHRTVMVAVRLLDN
jgi:hypothetical protein